MSKSAALLLSSTYPFSSRAGELKFDCVKTTLLNYAEAKKKSTAGENEQANTPAY